MASMNYQHLPSIMGIIGLGQVGSGLAALAARKGLSVIWYDSCSHAAASAKARLQRHLQHPQPAHPARPAADNVLAEQEPIESVLHRITACADIEALGEADFIFEAAPEELEAKKSIFTRLDKVSKVQTILASGTSSCSITKLARATTKPHRVVGMRFMHPVMTSPLVELAKGMHTSHQTYSQACSLAEWLGKTTVCSADRPGFLVFRMLMPMINEAFFCLMEGTGSAEDVDKSLRLGADMATGPLRTADEIGLDTCLGVMRLLHSELGDPKYRPCPLLTQYVDAGLLGAKTGRGVFHHEHHPLLDARAHHAVHHRPFQPTWSTQDADVSGRRPSSSSFYEEGL